MAIKRNPARYQVLYKAHPPKTGVSYVDCATLPDARREAARLRRTGEQDVRIWDTLRNPISDLLRLG